MSSCKTSMSGSVLVTSRKKNHAFIIGQKLLLEDLSDFRKIGPWKNSTIICKDGCTTI